MPNQNLRHQNLIGLLAQLVQSISFTPRGSGVRIPQGPPKKPQLMLRFFLIRAVSSVGLERCVDIAEVTGSNPVPPTKLLKKLRSFFWFMAPAHPPLKILEVILLQNIEINLLILIAKHNSC